MEERKPEKVILWAMAGWAILSTSFLLWLATYSWDRAPGIAVSAWKESTALGLVAILGGIGGLIRWMHWLRQTFGDSDNWTLWVIESVLMPLKGAALAIPFVLLLRAGIGITPPNGGGPGVNWIGLYAVAGLIGLFSPEAVSRLEKVFKSLFGEEREANNTQ
jgi:hypothetical protein